jgi:transcription initiation factor TFIIA large subunit
VPGRAYTSTPADVKNNIKPRIPQVDGPSSSSSGSMSPPASRTFAPHITHPSLAQPVSQASASTAADDEAINSDLDDSSTEAGDDADESGVGETDIVFCTYDKVRSLSLAGIFSVIFFSNVPTLSFRGSIQVC